MVPDKEKSTKEKEENEKPIQPDPETIGKTDPQEEMEGPISSILQRGKEKIDNDEHKNKDDAEKSEQ